jgi:hypothetical protein
MFSSFRIMFEFKRRDNYNRYSTHLTNWLCHGTTVMMMIDVNIVNRAWDSGNKQS